MTETKLRTPRRKVIRCFALAATLALAGCGSEHVGDSWQCPLAEGGSCASVAAADPAVPVTGSRTVLAEPLWKPRVGASEPPLGTVCAASCGDGSGPFGWLGRLFGSDGDQNAAPEPEDGAPEILTSSLADPASEALPAGHAPWRHDAEASGTFDYVLEESGPRGDDLRTGEVVARIWIAPFVDANGVYREAGHVRVVLEPAGWRDG